MPTQAYQPNNFRFIERPQLGTIGERLTVAGWLGLIGLLNLFYAIAVIAGSDIFITTASWLVGDARPWGWLMLIVALIQLAAVPAAALGMKPGLWIGVISAIAHIAAAIMFMTDEFVLGLLLVLVDIAILLAAAIAIEDA